jgi:4-amino-4-deoxy-L-arabinose transferase-like glycosyltransferase
MENRSGSVSKIILWLAWLAVIAVLAAKPFRWEVEYFRVHAGRAYFLAVVGLLLLLVPMCLLYVRWRRGTWYRFELPVIAGTAICLAAIEQPRGFGVGLLFFLASIAAGRRLARLFGIVFESGAETVGVGFSIGAAILIPILFILGLLHAYYWPVFLLLLFLPLVLFWRDALEGVRALGQLWRAATNVPALEHPLFGVAVIFLAAGVLCGTIAALAPSLVMDALKMHLPAAQSYVAVHALQPVSVLDYSYYPQGYEVLIASLYALGAQPAAQMITPIFFFALLLVIFEIAKLCAFDSAGILAGVASILMTPFILWDGSQVKNDAELALFQLAALYCCLRWRASEKRGWLVLGAILLAASFGIKHIAAFGAVPLVLLFIAPLYRKPRGVRTAAAFFLLLAVLGFYWHTRTFLLTGDPLYPRQVEEAVTPRSKAARSGGSWLRRRLEVPWRLQFNGTRNGFESPLRSPMGIMLLTLAPLALLAPRKRNSSRIACWFYCAVYILLWGSRMTTLRYALAPIAMLIVLVAAKAKEAYDQDWAVAPGAVRFSIAAAFAGTLAYGLLGTILVEIVPGQLPLLAGRSSRGEYLRTNLPGYGALQSLGRMNPNAAVLAVDACGRAYAPNPVTSACTVGGPHGAQRHVQKLLNRYDFQYVVLPVDWDDDERGMLFTGWKAEDVYTDRDWRAVRVTRNP